MEFRFMHFARLALLSLALTAPADAALSASDVTIRFGVTSGGSIVHGVFTPTAPFAVLSVQTLQPALAIGNVTVTTGTLGSQTGDIAMLSRVAWSAHKLTLDARHSILINAHMAA